MGFRSYFAAHNHRCLNIENFIQEQTLCWGRHNAVRPLFRFEYFGDVVGREAPTPDSLECSSNTAYHSVKKATALCI
jgi:hypothetical protein